MKVAALLLFLVISLSSFSQEIYKRILYLGDSVWYAGENQILFSSIDKGISWDTIFANKSQTDTTFFYGVLDTATNVFISDQQTLFVFGWDGTSHHKTILYSSSDSGKTWNKSSIYAHQGIVGVKYFHKISPTKFFLDCRSGSYALTTNSGKTWKTNGLINGYSCADERFKFLPNGNITYSYGHGTRCAIKATFISKDGGLTWSEPN